MALWRVAVDGVVRLARGPADTGPQEVLAAGSLDDRRSAVSPVSR